MNGEHSADRGNGLWVLGFDGTCCTCTGIARQIVEVSDGLLSVKSLRSCQVRRWRAETTGEAGPLTPTLFCVEADRVRAWAGPRLAWRMVRLLGIRRSWQVLQLLGNRTATLELPADPSRRRMIKGLAGAAVALTVTLGVRPFDHRAAAQETEGDWVVTLADDIEAAQLASAFNSSEMRTFVRYLTTHGYSSTAGGQVLYYTVTLDGNVIRNSAVQRWEDSSGDAAQIVMSVESDGTVTWYTGVVDADGNAVEELLLDENGDVYVVTPSDVASAAFPSWPFPNPCGGCKAACNFVVSAGGVAGALECAGACSAACNAAFFLCAAPCGIACVGLLSVGVGTLEQVGCPAECSNLGIC